MNALKVVRQYREMLFYAFLLFIAPAIVIVGSAVYYYQVEKKNALIAISSHEKATVQIGKMAVVRALDTVKGDLEYLLNYREFRQFLQKTPAHPSKHFTEDYKLFMKSRGIYDQIRWIDEKGMEKVRVDYNKGVPLTVPSDQLQNKSERYYFNESIGLNEGDVYFSPLDLNVEHEIIEIPYKPMIRIATPLIDNTGIKKGIFIINYLAQDLIDRFSRNTAISNGSSMLLNKEGYWLKGEIPQDEWGFMFDHKEKTMKIQNPQVWETIAKNNNGLIIDSTGLWTYDTIYPFARIYQIRSDKEAISADQRYYWKIVTFVPSAQLYKAPEERLETIVWISVLALLLALIASLNMAYLYSRQQKTLKSLKSLQIKTEGILSAVPDIVMQLDSDGKYIWANRLGIAFFGEEVIGKDALLYFKGEQNIPNELEKLYVEENGVRYTQSWQQRQDGEIRLLAWWQRVLEDESGKVIGQLATARDITEETMMHQEIERMAMIDNLTGIYNRHKFEEVFILESERARRFSLPLSIILIDIDHFKSVNDTYGHDAGDEILKGLALVVQSNIRKIDVFARWGGEEFLILSPGTTKENIRELAEKLRRAVEEAIFPEIGRVTISLGIATFKQKDSFSDLFKRADEGLYIAKSNGRNQVGYI